MADYTKIITYSVNAGGTQFTVEVKCADSFESFIDDVDAAMTAFADDMDLGLGVDTVNRIVTVLNDDNNPFWGSS